MILYLDTSAVVKLYVEEAGSDKVKATSVQARVVATSLIGYVEARAAFARALRQARLHAKAYRQAVEDLDRDWDSYFVLEVTADLVRRAGTLAEDHALRAYDALHLASALTLRDRVQRTVAFLCFDGELEAAARGEGLTTPPFKGHALS